MKFTRTIHNLNGTHNYFTCSPNVIKNNYIYLFYSQNSFLIRTPIALEGCTKYDTAHAALSVAFVAKVPQFYNRQGVSSSAQKRKGDEAPGDETSPTTEKLTGPASVPKPRKQKISDNEHSHGSFFLRIGAIGICRYMLYLFISLSIIYIFVYYIYLVINICKVLCIFCYTYFP